MSVKPIVGKGDDPSKGPPLARANVLKPADYDAFTQTTNSLTNSLTTTDLDSEIYKKKSVHYSDSDSEKNIEELNRSVGTLKSE